MTLSLQNIEIINGTSPTSVRFSFTDITEALNILYTEILPTVPFPKGFRPNSDEANQYRNKIAHEKSLEIIIHECMNEVFGELFKTYGIIATSDSEVSSTSYSPEGLFAGEASFESITMNKEIKIPAKQIWTNEETFLKAFIAENKFFIPQKLISDQKHLLSKINQASTESIQKHFVTFLSADCTDEEINEAIQLGHLLDRASILLEIPINDEEIKKEAALLSISLNVSAAETKSLINDENVKTHFKIEIVRKKTLAALMEKSSNSQSLV